MRLMIASDIHGSAEYCKRLLKAFKEEAAERLLILGDILYHGPRNAFPQEYAPQEVALMLNSIKEQLICVRGNCDTEVDQMVLEFPILSETALIYADGTTIFATHGHKFYIDKLPPLKKGDILVYGHTHIPLEEEREGIRCLNPGSISIPKGGSGHSYIIFEKGRVEFKSL